MPRRLRETLARLVGGRPEEIVLTNSTSYGLDLLARGLDLREGDEVLLVEHDFPATIFPWLPLRRRGVEVRFVPNPGGAPEPDDLRAALTDRTRVLCCSWVFSYTGHVADVRALADACAERGVTFILNGSQAVGARPTDVGALGVYALTTCGFKWLCGPYATGFTWLAPALVERLPHDQAYWLAQATDEDLSREPEYELRDDLGAAAFDVFCTANLATYPAWQRALDLLLDHGLDAVAAHDQALVQRLVDGLPGGWRLRSPAAGDARSTLVFVDADASEATARGLERLTDAGVDVALRGESLRLSPHVHNTAQDVDRALEALASAHAP